MVIWRITGESIGPDSCGAAHFATKEEAEKALREYRSWRREEGLGSGFETEPEKLVIKNRDDLAWHLDQAMGFGTQ